MIICAEWIDYLCAYKLYFEKTPQNAIAYVDSISEINMEEINNRGYALKVIE